MRTAAASPSEPTMRSSTVRRANNNATHSQNDKSVLALCDNIRDHKLSISSFRFVVIRQRTEKRFILHDNTAPRLDLYEDKPIRGEDEVPNFWLVLGW